MAVAQGPAGVDADARSAGSSRWSSSSSAPSSSSIARSSSHGAGSFEPDRCGATVRFVVICRPGTGEAHRPDPRRSHRGSGMIVACTHGEATSMPYVKDPRVDAYIDRAPDGSGRSAAGPRSRPRGGPRGRGDDQADGPAVLRARGQHRGAARGEGPRNVFLYDGGIVPDPEGIVTGGHGNETGRMIAVHRGRADQRAGPDRDVPADHREQPRRRLAQAQARGTAPGLIPVSSALHPELFEVELALDRAQRLVVDLAAIA